MHRYNIQESKFIQDMLGYGKIDGTISEDQRRRMRVYLGRDFYDLTTAYLQSKHNEIFYLRRKLLVDGKYGRNTKNALNAIMAKEVDSKAPVKKFDILDSIAKALPLWDDAAHDTVITHLTDTFNLIKDDLDKVHLNDHVSLSIFLGHMAHETGEFYRTRENLNYSCKALTRIFLFYRLNRKLAVRHGRCRNHRANQKDIANHAYANRYGNGGPMSGDGFLFRGGGDFQLTFRDNYQGYHDWLKVTLPEVYKACQGNKIMTEGVRIVSDSPHAVLSAIYFFNKSGMYKASKLGMTRKASDYATRRINVHTKSYARRWHNVARVYHLMAA